MGLIKNIKTVVTSPHTANNYLRYLRGKLQNHGQPIRVLASGIKIGGLTGFSEFHTCDCATQEEWIFLQNHLLESGDIIDIGANLGIITIVMAKRYPDRRIHSFEPNPDTYQSLLLNLRINGITNACTQNVAIAGREGEVYFNANPHSRPTNRITNSLDQFTINVPCTTLDAYTKTLDIKEIAFLKLDVEGHETDVLRGAASTLKYLRPKIIYYEVCPSLTQQEGFEPSLPTEILLENGYKIYELDEYGCLIPANIKNLHTITYTNWIAKLDL